LPDQLSYDSAALSFESICETCTYFQTTIEFRPVLVRQRDDTSTMGRTRPTDVAHHLAQHSDNFAEDNIAHC
jgi:hypothetical protein